MNVLLVCDELDERVVAGQCGDGHAGCPMIDARHGVEQVGRRRAAGVVAGDRGVQVGGRMTDRDADAERLHARDQLETARDLRGDRRQPEALDQRLDLGPSDLRRRHQVRRVVRPTTGGGNERALDVEAQRLRAVGRRARNPGTHAVCERPNDRQRVRDAGWQERGDAMLQEDSRHAVKVVGRAHRVVTAPAVDVDVHEARRDVRQRFSLFAGLVVDVHRGDPAVLDRQSAGGDRVVQNQMAADLQMAGISTHARAQTTRGRSTSRASRKPRFTRSGSPSKERSSCSIEIAP